MKDRRIDIRLSEGELEELRRIAAAFGGISSFVVWVIRNWEIIRGRDFGGRDL